MRMNVPVAGMNPDKKVMVFVEASWEYSRFRVSREKFSSVSGRVFTSTAE